MRKVLVTEDNLYDIANAIRSKSQGSDTYRPGDMAAAILAIPTGSTSTLVSKTITQNGEYDPEDDNADGYSDVTVNVPNSYTAADEGKVVSSGALVAQTSTTVTENGTYDTTENNEVVVNVSGGGGSTVLQYGPYYANRPIMLGIAGRFKLIVIAINSEAINKNLDIGVTVNQTSITGETLDYNSYSSSGNNRRNYRINEYDVNISIHDTITLSLENGGAHTSLFYVLGTIDINGLFQGMSTPDNITTGSYSLKAFVIYGISNNNSGGSISANTVNANETITTPDPVHSYGSSFIFWIDGDLNGGSQGGGDVILMSRAAWNALTTEEKRALELVAIQDADSGYLRGELVNGADYIPTPMIIYSGSQNVSAAQSLSHTFDSNGTYQIIVTCVSGTTDIKQSFSIQHNGVELQHTFTYPSTNNNTKLNLCVLEITVSTGDVISVSNTQNWSNSGMHLIILEYCDTSKVGLYNSVVNNGTSFTIDTAGWYLQVAQYGYYGSGNTVPTFEVDNAVKQSTPTPNTGAYWYGGTYVLTLA